jgi:hypothetical protein
MTTAQSCRLQYDRALQLETEQNDVTYLDEG